MKISFENESLTISGINQQSAELLMDSLVRFVNITIRNKSNDPATTDKEKQQLKYDKKSAEIIYRELETAYTTHFRPVEVDTTIYIDEEVQR